MQGRFPRDREPLLLCSVPLFALQDIDFAIPLRNRRGVWYLIFSGPEKYFTLLTSTDGGSGGFSFGATLQRP